MHLKSIQNSKLIFDDINKNFEDIRNFIKSKRYEINKNNIELMEKDNINTQLQNNFCIHKKRHYSELVSIDYDINRIKQYKTEKCKKMFKEHLNYIKNMKKGVDNINGFINYKFN